MGAPPPRWMGRQPLIRARTGKLSAVNVAETVLVFVGAPLAVVVLLALLAVASLLRARRRLVRRSAAEETAVPQVLTA